MPSAAPRPTSECSAASAGAPRSARCCSTTGSAPRTSPGSDRRSVSTSARAAPPKSRCRLSRSWSSWTRANHARRQADPGVPTANIATEMSPATYGAVVLQHFRRPLNRKDVIGATAIGEAANPLCGDRIRISASVAGDVIADIGFSGDACAVCVAAASLLTERVRGSSRIAAGAISDEALIASLETELPPARVRCATLPLDALRRALRVSPRHDDVAAVVLAAGRGTRFGGDKLSALLDGEPIIGHVVRNLAGFVGRVIVVAGPNPSPIQAIVGAGADVVSNGRAAEGMSTDRKSAV